MPDRELLSGADAAGRENRRVRAEVRSALADAQEAAVRLRLAMLAARRQEDATWRNRFGRPRESGAAPWADPDKPSA